MVYCCKHLSSPISAWYKFIHLCFYFIHQIYFLNWHLISSLKQCLLNNLISPSISFHFHIFLLVLILACFCCDEMSMWYDCNALSFVSLLLWLILSDGFLCMSQKKVCSAVAWKTWSCLLGSFCLLCCICPLFLYLLPLPVFCQ